MAASSAPSAGAPTLAAPPRSGTPKADATGWGKIVQLYDQLMAPAPAPVVALTRAVAVAETAGPAAGLPRVEALDLDGYHVLHAARVDLLRRLSRTTEAAEHTDDVAERAYRTAPAKSCAGPADGAFRLVRACGR